MVSAANNIRPLIDKTLLQVRRDPALANVSKPAYPVIRDNEQEGDSFKSQFKAWVGFDVGLKTLGLVFSTINNGVKKLRGIPIDKANVTTLANRFFTPNKIGFEIGLQAINQAKSKVLPEVLTKPLAILENAVSKAVGSEGIKVAAESSFFQRTLKPLFKFSGMPLIIAFECIGDIGRVKHAFEKGPLAVAQQLLKTGTKALINASAFCGGEIVGATIGAVIGGAIGSIIPVIGTALGAQVGGWIGGMAGGCTASYMSNKFINPMINPEEKKQPDIKSPFSAFTPEKLYA